jgi:tetratricopeptide (TPR) repeat protein
MANASPSRAPWLVLLAVLLAAGGFGLWYLAFRPAPPPGPDMAEVERLNARGVGLIEQYEYDKAAAAFEEVVKAAPDWTPGKINLGIALVNVRSDESLSRAYKLFQEVLQREPDNAHARYCLGIIDEHLGRTEPAHEHFTAVTKLDPNDPLAWYHRATENMN